MKALKESEKGVSWDTGKQRRGEMWMNGVWWITWQAGGKCLGGSSVGWISVQSDGCESWVWPIDPVIWNRSKLDHDICIIMCLQFCVSVSILVVFNPPESHVLEPAPYPFSFGHQKQHLMTSSDRAILGLLVTSSSGSSVTWCYISLGAKELLGCSGSGSVRPQQCLWSRVKD